MPLIVDGVRETYSGPVDFAKDFMVWNVTKEGTRTRMGVANPNRYPLPPLGEKQMAAEGRSLRDAGVDHGRALNPMCCR